MDNKKYARVKCDCGHYPKDHYQGSGFCHDSTHPNAGKCGCTWYHPNYKYILRQQKKLKNIDMKEEILKKFGENSTGFSTVAEDDIEFDEVTLSDDTSVSAFYTSENGVYILDSEGMDNDFDDYSKEDQKLIFDSIMSSVKEN